MSVCFLYHIWRWLAAGMTRKYEITDIQHPKNPKLFRIRALRSIRRFNVKVGDLGGYIEKESNLSQEGDCWSMDARVFENAVVYGDAVVFENAQIYGNAQIFGEAQIYGKARVSGKARVYGISGVNGHARIYGEAKVHGRGFVYGVVQVYAYAQVYGDAWVTGDTVLNEQMLMCGKCMIETTEQIYYADGVTACFDENKELIVNGSSPDIEHHKMLAKLKLL